MKDELRGLLPWRARANAWQVIGPRICGPAVGDTRWLRSREVLELVATHLGAGVSEVATWISGSNARLQGRYLLLGAIARTPRCTIVGAVDRLLARNVALKIPHERDDETASKLAAEVQAMTRIDHDNVVAAFDLGDHGGSVYAALELCDGCLDAWCVDKPWADVLDRVVEAGRGLAAVHAAGFVHGDLKPANVFVKAGHAKLGDFGMAARPGWSTRISGTPGYIAPEVADSQQSVAGDVFAFGCTAWVCLTGQPPFGDPPATANSSAAAMVLLERARAGDVVGTDARVPAAVIAVLRTALRPEPDERPALGELLEQLVALRSAGSFGRWIFSKRHASRARTLA